MQPRKVIITLEVTTNLSLPILRDKGYWADALYNGVGLPEVHQVQVNVVKKEKN